MPRLRHFALAAALAGLAAGAATAQEFDNQVAARQAQFKIMAMNLGILGGMAQGKMDYDAAMAQAAADNLVAISMINQSVHWPAGSDNMALEITRAKPEIWENLDDVIAKWNDFGTQAKALQAVASGGAEGLGAALGGVGGTCKACHDAYRGPQLQ